MGVCNCSMFCCTLLCVRSSITIILMGKRELAALLNLSSWCLVMVGRLFLAVPQGCLRFVIVVFFPDHTHLLFLCWSHLQPVWTQTRTCKMLCLIQIQTIRHSDCKTAKRILIEVTSRRQLRSMLRLNHIHSSEIHP